MCTFKWKVPSLPFHSLAPLIVLCFPPVGMPISIEPMDTLDKGGLRTKINKSI